MLACLLVLLAVLCIQAEAASHLRHNPLFEALFAHDRSNGSYGGYGNSPFNHVSLAHPPTSSHNRGAPQVGYTAARSMGTIMYNMHQKGVLKAAPNAVASSSSTTAYKTGYLLFNQYTTTDGSCGSAPVSLYAALGVCSPAVGVTDPTTGVNYMSSIVQRVTVDSTGSTITVKNAYFTDDKCTQGRMSISSTSSTSCTGSTSSTDATFTYAAALPAQFYDRGVLERVYQTTTQCEAASEPYAVLYTPAETCIDQQLFAESTGYASINSCYGANVGAAPGIALGISLYPSDADGTCTTSTQNIVEYFPTCNPSYGQVQSVTCTGIQSYGSTDDQPVASPTPGGTGANSGYVYQASFPGTANCEGVPSISAIQLGVCFANSKGSTQYSNYVSSATTNSVVVTKYTDEACTANPTVTTLQYAVGCSNNVKYSYSELAPPLPVGVALLGFANFEDCSTLVNPIVQTSQPIAACIGGNVLSSCTSWDYTLTSFSASTCSGAPDKYSTYLLSTCFYDNGVYYSIDCSGGLN